jgi:hypothetical protein
MEETSPREVLLKHGKWIGSTDFVELVARKRGISGRWAKKLITDAYLKKDIKKHIFPDRTVIYGLTEFGPPANWSLSVIERMPVSGGALVCIEHSGAFSNSQSRKQYSFPIVPFEVTQRVYDRDNDCYFPPNVQRPFPSVGFNMRNFNDYPVRVRARVRMILGGRDKGLIPDPKGYYNDETEMTFGPKPDGLGNGNFSVTEECEKSGEELTLQVSVIAIDPDNMGHRLSTKSWTYKRKENSWFYEPRVFVEEQWPNLRLG